MAAGGGARRFLPGAAFYRDSLGRQKPIGFLPAILPAAQPEKYFQLSAGRGILRARRLRLFFFQNLPGKKL